VEKPACRFCNAPSQEQEIRAEHVFGGKPGHKFWKCQACSLVYLYPVPSAEEEAYFYKKEFEKFMTTRAEGERDWTGPESHIKTNQDQVKRRWKFLEEFITPKKRVLEIGCSSGFMMDEFRNSGMETFGVEPSGEFLEFLKSRNHETFESVELLKQAHPGHKYDLIVHFFVLEHIRNTGEFIEEQLKLLNPDGVIIAEVPNVNDPLTSLYRIPAFEKFYWSIAHHYYFSPESLSKILDKIDCSYEFKLEQRYDLSNHMHWMQEGKPGGQGKYSHLFSSQTLESYKSDLIKSALCDTFFVYIRNRLS